MSVPRATPHHYRPDIDGLRAIAILGVVLYHANAALVPGGYVGVDVFFVISGFLITSILLRQMEKGPLSLKTFYERRIQRIVPACFAVLGLTLLAGWLCFLRWDFEDLAADAKYVAMSISNIRFNGRTGGYFGRAAETMPLLHTWSLGVEEQFYIFFPLILLLAQRLKWTRQALFKLLAGLGLVSLALCTWRIRTHPSDGFFLLPYRAWELTLGALLAFRLPQLGKMQAHGTGLAGLALIGIAMVCYNADTVFPGIAALLPCVGAMLVIAAGAQAQGASHWILSRKPLVWLGLISYSAYLLHWPLLMFQNYLNLDDPDNASHPSRVLVGLACFPLAYLSWRLIEQPARLVKLKPKWIWGLWGGLSMAVIVFSIVAKKTNGLVGPLPAQARQILAFTKSRDPVSLKQFYDRPVHEALVYGDPAQTPHWALWGDSHADTLACEMGQVARSHGAAFRFYGRPGGTPILGKIQAGDEGQVKGQYSEEVVQALEADPAIHSVVMMARWSGHIQGSTWRYGPSEKRKQKKNTDRQRQEEEHYAAGLHRTVARLRQAGKRVYLVYPAPETGHRIPETLAQEVIEGRRPEDFRIHADGVFFERQAFVIGVFDSLPDGPDLVRLKPHTWLIKDGHLRLMEDGKLFYRDDNHLSLEGAHLLRPMLEQIFADPPAGQPAPAPAKP